MSEGCKLGEWANEVEHRSIQRQDEKWVCVLCSADVGQPGADNPRHNVTCPIREMREATEAALRAETPVPTEGIEGMLARAVALAEIREIPTKSTIERWRAALFAKAAETPAPREPKLTISDLDEILGGYDSAHVTRGTVLQRLNEWLRIRAAGELEQAK